VKETILHVDFRRVDLKKKVETQVPVIVTGDSPAVKAGGVLLQQMQEVSVEALPQNIPHEISINIALITEIGQEIKISDLPKSDTYLITDEPSRVLVSVVAHKEESVEAQTERAETEITTAKEPAEGEEGAEPTEGETSTAGGKAPAAGAKAEGPAEKPAKDKPAK
jgi:large subunit ribosomal protein L25